LRNEIKDKLKESLARYRWAMSNELWIVFEAEGHKNMF
jgi:hypothetical protein